jgi:L-ascorbate metabolism protein UlaG (beta-lactamase superfamily)
MKLTKYGHACFTVEQAGQVLVVDPGEWSGDFVASNNIAAIVVTHEHADHFDPDTLAAIFDKNPNSILISLPAIVDSMPDHKSQAVQPGDKIEVGPFNLEFFGGKHAVIHDTIPIIDNIGVFINETVYYPGDSFALPNKPIDVLALPVGAPWLKISEAMDFLATVKPLFAFPTHDAVLSDIGKSIADGRLPTVTQHFKGEYKRIDGTTIEV